MDEARKRAERAALAKMLIGSLVDRSIPEWDTPESAREWVRAGRRARLTDIARRSLRDQE
ncbi:MAG: hypothetical protein ACRDJ9_33440 [Dehalococcoidia bacterium]